MRMIAGLACMCALALSACGPAVVSTSPSAGGAVGGSTAPPEVQVPIIAVERLEAVRAIANTAATVADAIGVAPSATLSRTTIDEKVINGVFTSADITRRSIDLLLDGGVIRPGSPSALRVRDGLLVTRKALLAASAGQRAGNATTYRAALEQAYAALTALGTDVAR